MADNKTELPEGTDKVIAGASATGAPANSAAAGSEVGGTETLTADATIDGEREMAGDETDASAAPSVASRSGGTVMDRVRSGGEKLGGQAADKARGLVGQGLERSAEALANVSKMIGDTAEGIDERLGAEYGDYARRAAGAIEGAANSLATKDPDELIDDTREFVRRSPGVALAGAAIVGFALARLLKAGLSKDDRDDDTA